MPQTKPKPKKTLSGAARKEKGAARERMVKAQLEARGWMVTKSSASLGLFDLICIHPDKSQALLIQVKSNRAPEPPERDKIFTFLVPDYCTKLVWIVKDGKPKEPIIHHYGSRNIYQVDWRVYLE